ncbi:glutathione S-transferase family protein [Providencia stuartii]|uniref:glutathione S-transferase family protein n=1 Tax=Providencia stuartii TaxID=588 RepID=UPI003D7FA1B3
MADLSTLTLFHDPTSEPSRAVHWLCIEANIPINIKYTWLTRGEHLSNEFLAVNPLHQIPAMQHDDFCLSEATAIMNYLTDIHGCSDKWFGATHRAKAVINKHLSWYHTNLRKISTLEYFLPVLLMPAYLGVAKPSVNEIEAKLNALHDMFANLDFLLEGKNFLAGSDISAADLLYACDIFALRIDPNFKQMIEKYPNIRGWLTKLESSPSYELSHKAWDHIVPQILALNGGSKGSPEWIADTCEKVIG